MTGAPVTGVRPSGPAAEQRPHPRVQVLAARLGEVAGQDPEQLVEVRAERAVRRLLDAEVLEDGDAVGGRDPPRGARGSAPHRRRSAARSRRSAPRASASRTGSDAVDVLGEEGVVQQVLLHERRRSAARHQASLPGRTRRWKSASLAVSVTHRVDDDHRALGVLGDLAQHDPGAREALRHPRVLADEHRHLGVLELAARVTAVELRVDPRLAGLLLGEGAGAVPRSRAPSGRRRCRRRRGGCPGRRRRNRRSTRRRAGRESGRSRPRPR